MMTRFIRNRRGQVAIFIALLFQVLFLFFAMIVNVGLLVHHKINLQNSVDLAAYYGAMKQAEVLNAIAHVNYQIRQSWKLLVWRHRVLGSAGAATGVNALPLEKLVSNSGVAENLAGSGNQEYERLYKTPRFCIAYSPHEVDGQGAVGNAENSCKKSWDIDAEVKLPNPGVLQIASFNNFGSVVAAAITQAITQTTNRCAAVGSLNFVVGAKFVIGHIMDAQERAHLINFLATGISAEEDNFFDLDGDSAKVGIEKTLKKNLTDANRDSVTFEMVNGLALGDCRANRAQVGAESTDTAPPWLVPIQVYPVWRYVDCEAIGTTVKQEGRHLDATSSATLPKSRNIAPQPLQDQIDKIVQSGILTARPTLIGFEKSPWCMSYVGVKAKSKPKIPFMPLSEVELTAEAYAKPFGGRIGPWYTNTWPSTQHANSRITDTEATGGSFNRLEPNGPIRVMNVSNVIGIDDPQWVPNVARMVGDGTVIQMGGYAMERVLAYFHRAIRADLPNSTYGNILASGASYPFPVGSDSKPSLTFYDGVGAGYSTPEGRGLDQLSWSKATNTAPKLRLLEIAAIAPNLFDLAYYSIEPDFYNNYYKRIETAIKTKRIGDWDSSRHLLGDQGARFDTIARSREMNIFDQIRVQRDLEGDNALSSTNNMPYVVKISEHLLNSWSVDGLLDYRSNNQKFGKCLSPETARFEQQLPVPTPGNCIDGGRVGFSVKMVSKDYLNASDLELGGQGTTGPLKNPLPSGW